MSYENATLEELIGYTPEKLTAELSTEEWVVTDERKERSVFIGTVMTLYPSGKFYMPFACSNVNEEEADKDTEWRERLEELLNELNLSLTSGEGDPCDLYVTESIECDEDEDDMGQDDTDF